MPFPCAVRKTLAVSKRLKMARFFADPSILDRDQAFQHGDGVDTPPDSSLFETDDLASAFADSFLDFDSIKNWIEEFPDTSWDSSAKVDLSGGLNGNTKPSNGPGFVANSEGGPCGESCADGSEKLHNLGPSVGEGMREMGRDGFAANSEDVDCGESCIGVSIIDGCEKMRDLGPSVGEDMAKRERDRFSVILEDGYGGKSCFDGSVMSGSKKFGNLGPSVEEGMAKGSVVLEADGGLMGIDENGVKRENDNLVGGDDISNASVSVSESESTSSSSELSTSSDDESGCCGEEVWPEKKKKEDLAEEREEGEIIDSDAEDMDGWSGSDARDEDDDGGGSHRFRSTTEVEDLPPVPPVNVALQGHHQTQPVGIVLSIIGAQVIVEGVEKHNPLNEGSILWITDARSPLGLIDEVFGPVKNPYYAVRYNSENEVPGGIHVGTSVSFVSDFANHVLNDNSLYKKGYDVSSENSEDELEFSDDEKEAVYKRMMKMNKRGMNDERVGKRKNNRRKGKCRDGNGTQKQGVQSASQALVCTSQLPSKPDQNQHRTPHMVVPQDRGNCASFLGTGHTSGFFGGAVPQISQPAEFPGFSTVPSGFWTNGFQPCLQQPVSVLPNRSPAYGLVWPQQHYPSQQNPQQMSLPNVMPPIQQHFNQQIAPLGFPQYGQMNSITGPTYRPCPHPAEQNGFNQTPPGMDLHGQISIPSWPPMTTGGQGVLLNRPQTAHNSNQCPASAFQDSAPVPQKFRSGAFPGHGKRPYREGGGRFQGGRGQQQLR